MDVHLLPSYMIMMMLAMLLFIFMDMALKKKKNCNGSKQSSLAGRALPSDSRHQYRACHCVLMFPASQAAQHLESQ